jgi:hypothetical protein
VQQASLLLKIIISSCCNFSFSFLSLIPMDETELSFLAGRDAKSTTLLKSAQDDQGPNPKSFKQGPTPASINNKYHTHTVTFSQTFVLERSDCV